MVELGLVLPVVLLMIFGVIECGRLMLTYTTLAHAARAGTRYAIVHGSYRTGSGLDGPSGPGNTGNVTTVVKNIATAAGLSLANLQVIDTVANPMYPDGTNDIAALVKVRVTYSFSSIVSIVPLSVTLGSTSEGRICY
jgi:Flp pilus assembly protein TadG